MPGRSQCPEIDNAGCVRGQLVVATCTDCITACPTDALFEAADGTLSLQPDACTGCGACVAACPETAIRLPSPARDRVVQATGARLTLVCERHPAARGRDALTCVHCLGLADLARLWRAGLRRVNVATGDCATCATCPTDLFDDQLARFNNLARSRGLAEIALRPAGTKALAAWRDTHTPTASANLDVDPGPDPGRRAFLRGFTTATAPDADPPENGADLAAFFQQASPDSDPVFPVSPQIDQALCSACDACTQVCPHEALILINDNADNLSYRVTASRCTGCGLCVDVCDEDAITLARMTGLESDISLSRYRCKACGNWQNSTDSAPPSDGLCRICRVNDSRRNLFVILP